jgi:transposase InsO family protein
MAKRQAVYSLESLKYVGGSTIQCTACIQGKQHRAPIPKVSHTKPSTELLHIVHSDICGPMSTASLGGSRYFATFIDDCSRRVWVYFLNHKSDLLTAFKQYKALVENQSHKRIKVLRTDNGGEYISHQMQSFLKENGIEWQPTAPHTPEHNGVAERMNRTLLDTARTMLIEANLDNKFWAEAVNTAAYIINRRTTKRRKHVTPEEL